MCIRDRYIPVHRFAKSCTKFDGEILKSNKMPTTTTKLFSLALHDKENLRDVKSIDLGFHTKKLLKEATSKKVIS